MTTKNKGAFDRDDIMKQAQMDDLMYRGSDNAHEPIEDTAQSTTAAVGLANAILSDERGGRVGDDIRNQEAAGQQQVLNAAAVGLARFPIEGSIKTRHGKESLNKKIWESFGFEFGDIVDSDEIWIEVKLPEGWKIEATDHSMWSMIYDEKGRDRGGLFYKAAFYDRSCNVRPHCRFSTKIKAVTPGPDDWKGPQMGYVLDCEKIIQTLGPFENGTEPEDKYSSVRWRSYELAENATKEWLAANYPNYNDPGEYWD